MNRFFIHYDPKLDAVIVTQVDQTTYRAHRGEVGLCDPVKLPDSVRGAIRRLPKKSAFKYFVI
jgi:hypothetical protein